MRLEAIRMTHAVLEAQLVATIAALTMDTPVGAGQPDARPPNPAAILNVADDVLDLSERTRDTQWPLVVVRSDELWDLEGEVAFHSRDADAVITSVLYLTSKATFGSPRAWRDTEYTLNAVRRCLRLHLLDDAVRDVAGVRNNVALEMIGRMVITPAHPIREQQGMGSVMGELQLEMHLRDYNP